ncbi:MAG: PAS domain S-box protein [Pseudomonadota bacterium]
MTSTMDVGNDMETVRQDSEELYRSLVEGSFDGIFIRKHGKIVFANSRLYEMLGYEPGELEGLERPDIYHPEDRQVVHDRALARLKKESIPPKYDVRMQRKDGSCFPAELDARVAIFRDEPAIQVWVRDISWRKQAEEERLLLVTAIEQAAELIVIFDRRGRIRYINPAFTKVTGYTREEILGRHTRILRPGLRKDPLYRAMWENLANGRVWSGRLMYRRRDGNQLEVEGAVSPVRDEARKIASYVAVVRDVTNEVALEKQLRQAQKLEAIGTLAGGIAHDFNNILYVISGFTQLAQDDTNAGQRAHRNLGHVLDATERARDLVNQILTFCRRSEQEKKPILLAPIVKEVCKFLRASTPSTMAIRYNIGQELGRVMADPTQMHQVLMNLCTNAAQAMGEKGGILEVDLQQAQTGSELIAQNRPPTQTPYLKLTVSDTGQGMPPELLERIFEPYFTTKKQGEGTGLGLAVVHGIVESHGGTITVESGPGSGTVFRVCLPVIPETADQEIPEPEQVPSGRERILLVDDEEFIVKMAKEMLERLGYEVVPCTGGMEAAALFRKAPEEFDLLISDLTMPGMSGMELAKELKNLRPGLPVILCTGFSETITEQAVTEAGIGALLMKPIRRSTIAGAIRKVLGK